MTPALHAHLAAMTPAQRSRLATDSRKALRVAWPNRQHFMNRDRVRANVRMLRNLRAL